MKTTPTNLSHLLNARLVLALTAILGVSSLPAQAATIGYDPLAPSGGFTFATLSTSTAYVVPFQFNTLGDYSLDSVSLLLRGTADLADFSLSVSATLPIDLTDPLSLTTLSATGSLSGGDAVYTFGSSATPTLTANTTYYLRVAYDGAQTANWIATSSEGGEALNYGGFTFRPVSGAVFGGAPGTPGNRDLAADNVTYRSLTSAGFRNSEQTMGGFSLTATAVNAVPEPTTFASLIGAATLAAARLFRRRRNCPPTA